MVWFQCEDCGENLKKPKLPNHFRICSAYKLSCIDCGKTFDQESVQGHTQCISEAEKYGPKGQGKVSSNTKPEKPKPNADVDVNVGLSSRPPWICSLCNTRTTSQQTLLLHADGKKHRAKARAFHASQKQSTQAVEPTSNEKDTDTDKPMAKSAEINGCHEMCDPKGETLNVSANVVKEGENESQMKRKWQNASGLGLGTNAEEKSTCNLRNGEVIQAEQTEDNTSRPNKKKHVEIQEENCQSKQDPFRKIKWKKLVTSTLKANRDGKMRIKKLQKVVIKALLESSVTEDEVQLREMLMDKISSSSRFVVENKKIQLVSEAEES